MLGQTRDLTAMHVVTEIDPETGALFARNSFRTDFAANVAFADVDRRPREVTADRTLFLGRHGSLRRLRARLPRVSAPSVRPLIRAPQSRSPSISNPEQTSRSSSCWARPTAPRSARALFRRYRQAGSADESLTAIKKRWNDLLETVQVRTPDPALDILVNRWLLYQVQSCRVWGRSAFYQSGGAYGFRDQLQDVMALFHAAPPRREPISFVPQAASSQKATSSTGGTPRRDVVSAPGSPTIHCGSRSSPADT